MSNHQQEEPRGLTWKQRGSMMARIHLNRKGEKCRTLPPQNCSPFRGVDGAKNYKEYCEGYDEVWYDPDRVEHLQATLDLQT